jgi:Mycotoxin biosynthesis protein UstYa
MIKSEYMHLADPKKYNRQHHFDLNLTDHIPHCFDYVRQGIMCAGDSTLEHVEIVDGKPDFLGWDVRHECRAFEIISQWASDHRVDDYEDIV